jgi:uncharacterized membrane protein YqjE
MGFDADSAAENRGLFAGLAALTRNLFGLLLSRIELAALELAEIRGNLLRLLWVFALGIMAIWFAVFSWTALLVVVSWDAMGWKIIAIVALAFTLLAAGILFYARGLLQQGRLSMPATMAELRNDRDALL